MPSLVCFLNKVDAVDDPELLELVEMELRGKKCYLIVLLLFEREEKFCLPLIPYSNVSSIYSTNLTNIL